MIIKRQSLLNRKCKQITGPVMTENARISVSPDYWHVTTRSSLGDSEMVTLLLSTKSPLSTLSLRLSSTASHSGRPTHAQCRKGMLSSFVALDVQRCPTRNSLLLKTLLWDSLLGITSQ